jgi:hypothetical protein
VDDHPLEAERVGLAIDLRAGAAGDGAEQLFRVVLGRGEFPGRERLEDQCGIPGGLQRALRLEGDRGGREREEPLAGGLLELLAAEEDVAEPGQDSVASSAGG